MGWNFIASGTKNINSVKDLRSAGLNEAKNINSCCKQSPDQHQDNGQYDTTLYTPALNGPTVNVGSEPPRPLRSSENCSLRDPMTRTRGVSVGFGPQLWNKLLENLRFF
ncbi:hypothetical protein ILYODFUR_026993 [Ilyodon furcidens]|uniref:Uncharacterized protein n=1 Tax=Ilyodon furcidens TaxID=33524 RepID=A0ABV0U8U3_9TELE